MASLPGNEDPSGGDADAAPPDEEAPRSPERPPSSVFDPVRKDPHAPPDAERVPPEIMRVAVDSFVGTRGGQAFIVGCVREYLGDEIAPDLLDDLQQSANMTSLTAKALPWFRWGIKGWVRRVTRRAIVNYFRRGEVHDANLDHDKRAELQADRDSDEPDYAARERMITAWLGKQAEGDPREAETVRLMAEHEIEGLSLGELAKREKTTPNALSLRFSKLRKKYIPRLARMDDEPKRRAVILLLLFLGALGVVAVVLWLLWPHDAARTPPPPVVPLRPVPTASAPPEPSFDQALPPRRGPPPVDDGLKP
jgi:DNA-directed RNA polymerase specialized sigma24 family protein